MTENSMGGGQGAAPNNARKGTDNHDSSGQDTGVHDETRQDGVHQSEMRQDEILHSKARIDELIAILEHHIEQYYVLDNAEIEDAEYDALFRELQVLEKKYPALKREYSPTTRVGGAVVDFLPKARHTQSMYSLDNAFSPEEWNDYIEKIIRLLPGVPRHTLAFWVEPKMDGLAMELIYENGIFHRALTRGDGEIGEVVTEAMRTVKNIPLRLRGENIPKLLEVRGEVLIAKKDFLQLNEEQEKLGAKSFANPRNAAAGSVRQLDSSIAATRPLRFLAYGVGSLHWGDVKEHPAQWKGQAEIMQALQCMGFEIPPHATLCQTPEETIQWFQQLGEQRGEASFELDGGVAKINELSLQEKLGFTAHAPRWAIAWKFAAMQARTVLKNITIQVGRTGVLTPVAELEPVNVGGVVVSRATLHNEDELRAKDVRLGDTVIVQRAGDVIPEIVRSVTEMRTGNEQEFIFPTTCPECESFVHRAEGEVAWRCINTLCPAILRESIKHFISKAGLDVKGLGSRWVELLVDKGLVSSPADFFRLTKEDLLPLDRMGETLAAKFITALESARSAVTLPKLLSALGIRHVGEQTAKALARQFTSMDALMQAQEEELLQVHDVGREVAKSIMAFFSEPGNKILLQDLRKLNLWPNMHVQVSSAKSTNANIQQLQLFGESVQHTLQSAPDILDALERKTFLFTGTLSMPRQEAEQMVEQAGGDVVRSVSKKLDYLVAGESPGSKFTKAQNLGIEVLNEDDFLALLKRKD